MGSGGFSWVLVGSGGFSWVLVGSRGFSWVLLGSGGFFWVLVEIVWKDYFFCLSLLSVCPFVRCVGFCYSGKKKRTPKDALVCVIA